MVGRINIGTNQQTTLRQVAHPSSLSILMLVLLLFQVFFGLKLREKIFDKINVVIFEIVRQNYFNF